MNRSFSKIRHIQEANQMLEKRLISEQQEISVEEIKNLGMIARNIVKKYSNEISQQKDKMTPSGNPLLNKQMDSEVLKFQKLVNSLVSKSTKGDLFFNFPKLNEDGFIGPKTIQALTMAENRR